MCVCVTQTLFVCVCVQPPPRRPLNFAESHENDEEKEFRKAFQRLAGDVSLNVYMLRTVMVHTLYLFHPLRVTVHQ